MRPTERCGSRRWLAAPILLGLLGLPAWSVAEERRDLDLDVMSRVEAPTQLDPIEVRPLYTFPGDVEWAKLRRELECSDCIDVDHSKLPVALAIAAAVGQWAVGGLLPQPRVRGEPNDEALLQALQQCWVDDGNCGNSNPSTAVYNWAPDEHQSLLDDPNAYAR